MRGLHVWGFTGTTLLFDQSDNTTLEANLIGATATFADPDPLRAAINVFLDRCQNLFRHNPCRLRHA